MAVVSVQGTVHDAMPTTQGGSVPDPYCPVSAGAPLRIRNAAGALSCYTQVANCAAVYCITIPQYYKYAI